MKVLLVNKFHYRKGGSETYYFTLAQALARRGHEVIFFAMQDEKNLPCPQEGYFVSNASVGGSLRSKMNMVMHIAYSKEAYGKMKQLLAQEKPDLVIMNLVHKQITLSILDAIGELDAKVPVFWTMHDLIAACPAYTMLNGRGEVCEKCMGGQFGHCVKNKCIKGSRLMSMLSYYEARYIQKKQWYDRVDLYICPSEFYANKLRQAGFTRQEIVAMRNPLPADIAYGGGTAGDYVLYFGRLSREKGVKTLIDAAKAVGCKLEILGTGPMEDAWKAYAKDAPDVHFRGFQTGEALQAYIRNCRCVVLPSEWYENGPYSAMEAMALGKPIIVSDMGGLPELVCDGANGYVYAGGSEALAECIRKMFLLDGDAYEQMSHCAQETAKSLFDADQYVTFLEKKYRELAGESIWQQKN